MENTQIKINSNLKVFSGITPSSSKGLHLGNYFGAVKPQVEFQNKASCQYFVANIHALNSIFDSKEVEENTMNVFMEYLAFGVDTEKTLFFIQSDIHSIPYLQTILNNVITLADMKRMHAYKDKLQNDVAQEAINMGLFSYPILMAADILIFKPDLIPVGEDQSQHVEIAREMARNFNKRYGKILKVPSLYLRKNVARVKGTDGERKMSKSLSNDISVFAEEKIIKKQIMGIKTDTARVHPTDPGDPNKNVAFDYLQLLEFDKAKLEEMKDKYRTGNIKDVFIKQTLFEKFMDYFKESRNKKKELTKNLDYVSELRIKGAEKANQIAEKNIEEIKDAVGLRVGQGSMNPCKERKPVIQFDDFAKLDIRIGTVKSAEKVEGADKLVKIIFDFGTEERQLLAGIAKFYKPEDLIGKQMPVLTNLEPKVMKGLESQGMIMAVDEGNRFVILKPERFVKEGSIVR